MAKSDTRSVQLNSTDLQESAEIEAIVSRWVVTLPSDPYIISVPSEVPYNRPSAQSDNWKLDTLWDPDEEHLQYISSIWRDPWNTLFATRNLFDWQRDNTPFGESNPPTDRSGPSTPLLRGAKKKINLRDYKARLARSEGPETTGLAPTSGIRPELSPAFSIHVHSPADAAAAFDDSKNHDLSDLGESVDQSSPFLGSSPQVTVNHDRQRQASLNARRNLYDIKEEVKSSANSPNQEVSKHTPMTLKQGISEGADTKVVSDRGERRSHDTMGESIPWIFSSADQSKVDLLESNLTLDNILNLRQTPTSALTNIDQTEADGFSINLPSTPPTSVPEPAAQSSRAKRRPKDSMANEDSHTNELEINDQPTTNGRHRSSPGNHSLNTGATRKHSRDGNDIDTKHVNSDNEHLAQTVSPEKYRKTHSPSRKDDMKVSNITRHKSSLETREAPNNDISGAGKPHEATSSELRIEFKTLHNIGRQLKHRFQAQAAEAPSAVEKDDEANNVQSKLLVAVLSVECLLCFMTAYATQDQYAPNWEAWWSLHGLSQVITKCCQNANAHLHGLCLALRALIYERVVRSALRSEIATNASGSEHFLKQTTQSTLLVALNNLERCSEVSKALFSSRDFAENYPRTFMANGSIPVGVTAHPAQLIAMSLDLLHEWTQEHRLEDQWQPKLDTELCSVLRSVHAKEGNG